MSEIAMDNNNFCPIYSGILMSGSCHFEKVLKLVLKFKYFILLYFLTAAKFYNLGHIQGALSQKR